MFDRDHEFYSYENLISFCIDGHHLLYQKGIKINKKLLLAGSYVCYRGIYVE